MIRWLLLLALLLLAWRVLRTLAALPRDAPRDAGADQADRDPHDVLGVPPGADGAEIARAYRERLKEYHPDRVASLGPELRDLAHRKTLEIQRAWEALRQR